MGIVDVGETAVMHIGKVALPSWVLLEECHCAVLKEGNHVLVVGAPEIRRTNQGIKRCGIDVSSSSGLKCQGQSLRHHASKESQAQVLPKPPLS